MGYTRQSRSELSFAWIVESVAIPKIIPKTEKNSRQLWIKETRRFCKYTKIGIRWHYLQSEIQNVPGDRVCTLIGTVR